MGSDDELPSLDEASTSVDALVADDDEKGLLRNEHTPGRSQSCVPPFTTQLSQGFLPVTHGSPLTGFEVPPAAAPPGLVFGPGHVVPMQPAVPITPTMVAATLSSQMPRSAPTGPKQDTSKKATPGAEAKKKLRALAVDSGLSRDIASHASPSKGKAILQDEDFPALHRPKSGVQQATLQPSAKTQVPTPKPIMATPKKSSQQEPSISPVKPEQGKRANDKRPPKNVLNIAAATSSKAAQAKSVDVTPIDKPTVETSESSPATGTPSSTVPLSEARPSTPSSVSGVPASSVSRAVPKTLRLVSTPKTEGVPGASASGAASGLLAMPGRIVRPGTPTSEIISDSASIVSASIPTSRANSPPPSKIVGSAHVRATTKSQQRKQRKEAHKGMTEVIVEAAKPDVEEHAPVLGRKKKQKKEKPSKASKKVDLVAETSSAIAEASESGTKAQPESANENEQPMPPAPVSMSPAKKGKDSKKAKGKAKELVSLTPAPAPAQPEVVRPEPEKPFEKPEPTPELIFRELVRDGLNPDKLSLLKPINSHALRAEASAMASKNGGSIGNMHDPKLFCKDFVSNHEEIVLLAGKPIRRVENGQRVLITPYGDVVRSLTEEEEDRYLMLQDRVAQHANDPVAFKADQHRVHTGDFSIVEGRMVANGPPSFFPQGEDDIPKSYNTKIRREEAIAFANQFAMPSMRLGNRTLVGSNWRDELEDPNTAEVMNRLKAMFYDQKSTDSRKPRVNALFQSDFGGETQEAAAGRDEQPQAEGEAETAAKAKKDVPARSRENLFADEVDENPINDELLPRFLGPGGRDTFPPKPAPPLNPEELEKAFLASKKETDKYEKALNAIIKKNKRLLLGGN
ncbi:hypothetical protein jhhlp_003207 [Lomentospora prolificans]|uniref:Uncharacterized protein n=1 Tax=Lomentospora prolificans TaxID=41688 RepID=A0A2N3NG87_9PEZI|nr:hypothetical protein jhhlp_003207 [Lomentospora prolificans]